MEGKNSGKIVTMHRFDFFSDGSGGVMHIRDDKNICYWNNIKEMKIELNKLFLKHKI